MEQNIKRSTSITDTSSSTKTKNEMDKTIPAEPPTLSITTGPVFEADLSLTTFKINRKFFEELYEALDLILTVVDRVKKSQFPSAAFFQKGPGQAFTQLIEQNLNSFVLKSDQMRIIQELNNLVSDLAFDGTITWLDDKKVTEISGQQLSSKIKSLKPKWKLTDLNNLKILLKRFGKIAQKVKDLQEAEAAVRIDFLSDILDVVTR